LVLGFIALVVFQVFLSEIDHILRKLEDLHDLNTVALLHLALLHLVLQHQLVVLHAAGRVHVLHSNHLVSHASHLVEMSGKQAEGINFTVEVFADFPRNPETLARAGASSKLVNQNQ
jgi:hypothetical protein